ncbi:MAG: T9SS type A sorting domain-containing protein, partial [Bacteroidetes bacterium]|nr:T9SS type A sorting domain-containing protein [Bacteroidota bacterium]
IIPGGSNGDGVFFYPGQESTHPNQDRGLQGPLSSIRMKNWRRGVQDMEYIWLLNKQGYTNVTAQILNACVPKALWDAKNTDPASWPSHGFGCFDKSRRQMAQLLESVVTSTDTIYSYNNLTVKNYVSIYPNPANTTITIEIKNTTKENKIIICNINGQELIRQQIKDSETQVDISNLTSGLYFVKLITDKTVEVRKIIKE